jgi:transcriptional regulator with XRE-family HTH domain
MQNRVRELRAQQGLAQRGLATRAQVSPTLIATVERWDYRPTERVRERLAAALGVDADELFPRERIRVPA